MNVPKSFTPVSMTAPWPIKVPPPNSTSGETVADLETSELSRCSKSPVAINASNAADCTSPDIKSLVACRSADGVPISSQ